MTKTTTPTLSTPTTTAFFAQSAISFGIASLAVGTGIAYLPVDRWTRGFLAIGCLFLVSSAFTLAKCVRDQQEQSQVLSRVDQARLEKMLAEHDPFTGTRTAA
jgi:hypothetical protein